MAAPAIAVTLALMLPSVASGEAQEPIDVTTDSAAYCHLLEGRLKRDPGGEEAARLATEGAAMCRDGHIRGGIIRLRRALMIAHDRRAPDE